MFEILSKIYNGTELVKYEVLNLETNKISILSLEVVQGLAMANSLTNAVFSEKSRTLKGKNFDLRTLPKKQENYKSNKRMKFFCLDSNDLYKFVIDNTKSYRKERYLLKDLMNFLLNSCDNKICALYGLRRTGKTVMMYQAIKQLFSRNITNIAYMTLTETNSLYEFFNELDKLVNNGIKYIFVDEITALNGFIQSSALLSDKYAKLGVHLVIAGTDSYVIGIAEKTNLYDRVKMLSTTYIGYKEYEYLNNGITILDYIRLGGVLSADIFYNFNKTKDYINTAITNNIINSLVRANNRKQYQRLLELYDRGLLRKAIEQAIASSNEELTVGVLTHRYFNESLGSAKQLMESVFNISSVLNTEEVETRIRYKLGIVLKFDAEISEEYIDELKDFLLEIGAIKMYSRYVCTKRKTKKIEVPLFVQPGLRYRQTVNLIDSLCETSSFFGIPKSIREDFKRKIIEDVEGMLLEHEVLLSFLSKYNNPNVEVTQLIYENKEIDLIVHDTTKVNLYEIKRTNKVVSKQSQWLVNKEVNDFIVSFFGCNIVDRAVLYLGKDTNDVVKYRNIEKILKNKY